MIAYNTVNAPPEKLFMRKFKAERSTVLPAMCLKLTYSTTNGTGVEFTFINCFDLGLNWKSRDMFQQSNLLARLIKYVRHAKEFNTDSS